MKIWLLSLLMIYIFCLYFCNNKSGDNEYLPIKTLEPSSSSLATTTANTTTSYNCTITSYAVPIGWIGGGSDGWKTSDGAISGTDYKSFNDPWCIFVDTNDTIYVSDRYNNRISKWDSSGNAIGWIGGGSDGWKTSGGALSGNDYKSFNDPFGVFIDPTGNIFITDQRNLRISKWDNSGNAIGWIGGGSDGWKTSDGAISSTDTDYKSFSGPTGIFIDNGGNIYISCYRSISKWDSSGNAIGWIGGGSDGWKITGVPLSGTDYKSFILPSGVYVDSDAYIYVADSYNNRVCKWDSSGNAIGFIGYWMDGWHTINLLSNGQDYKSFLFPFHIVFDSQGYMYVSDMGYNRISKWDSSGNAIGCIGNFSCGWDTSEVNYRSSDYHSFYFPRGVFVYNSYIYIADTQNNRICKWKT